MTEQPRPDQDPDAHRSRVSEVWSQDAAQRAEIQGWYWMAHPMVRARVNTLISGDPACDAYGRLERLYRERGWTLPIREAVSVGCGFGNLERDLLRRGWVERITAYDLADGAIAQARRLAEEAGLSGRVTYRVADLDTLELEPGSADAVFAHSAIHHVRALEQLYATIHAALRPGGVFHLHEFVGPTRFQWTDAQIRLVNEFMDALPPRLRRLPGYAPKGPMRRPTLDEMLAADPSEAIRSAELVSALDPWFEIVEERRIGGALLHLALGDIAQNFDPAKETDRAILLDLFAREDQAIEDGTIGSDFAIVTAVRRPQPRAPALREAMADDAERVHDTAFFPVAAGGAFPASPPAVSRAAPPRRLGGRAPRRAAAAGERPRPALSRTGIGALHRHAGAGLRADPSRRDDCASRGCPGHRGSARSLDRARDAARRPVPPAVSAG